MDNKYSKIIEAAEAGGRVLSGYFGQAISGLVEKSITFRNSFDSCGVKWYD